MKSVERTRQEMHELSGMLMEVRAHLDHLPDESLSTVAAGLANSLASAFETIYDLLDLLAKFEEASK